MEKNIFKILDNLDVSYDLSKDYIHFLFLQVKTTLKCFTKRYRLKKKYIVKSIFNYYIKKMNIDPRVIQISKLKQPAQRSQEWYDARYNKITASEISSITGTNMDNICQKELDKIYKKPGFKSYYDLLKTKILKNDEFRGNKYTEHGQIFEPIATSLYEVRTNNNVIEFGLIEHPTISIIAASPDGITKDKIMLEIKAPYSRKLSGKVPLNYWIQMQIQMETCNLERCHFVEIKTNIYSKEEFDSDSLNDIELKTKNNLEKGIIIKCKIEENKYEYFYPPTKIFTDKLKLIEWADSQLNYYSNNYIQVELVYWKLNEYSCIEVNRDKNWFIKTFPKYEAFWKEVIHHRNNKDEFIKNDNIKNELKQKKKTALDIFESEKLTVLTMLDTSDDESENSINSENNVLQNKPEDKLSNSNDNICSIENDLNI